MLCEAQADCLCLASRNPADDASDARDGLILEGKPTKRRKIERLTCTELGEASSWAVLMLGAACECKPASPSQHPEGGCKAGAPAACCALQDDTAARCMWQLPMLVDVLHRTSSVSKACNKRSVTCSTMLHGC